MQNSEDDIKKLLHELENLVQEPGFIYSFSMLLVEGFNQNIEQLHEVDAYDQLTVNEAKLIGGFLIKRPLDFSPPSSLQVMLDTKVKIRNFLTRLQKRYSAFVGAKMFAFDEDGMPEGCRDDLSVMEEPIFYSGTGAYDFQFLEFLDTKYQEDKSWLFKNAGIDITQISQIYQDIRFERQEKVSKVKLYVNSAKAEILKKIETIEDDTERQKQLKAFEEMQPYAEMHQYVSIMEELPEFLEGKVPLSFCEKVLDLCCVNNKLFTDKRQGFLKQFRVTPAKGVNTGFNNVGDFNELTAKPLIEVSRDKTFLLCPHIFAEAVYEAPFYWMLNDKEYKAQAEKNRGNSSETLVANLLREVFDEVHSSVLVEKKKGEPSTDIDTLCIKDNVAVCVQIKSKKLTQLAKQGDAKALKKDFKLAVQDAYEQALKAGEHLTEKDAKFFSDGADITERLKEVDTVYPLIITTDNYSALTYQTQRLLEVKEGSERPLVTTVFDLQILMHYLKKPYEFIYYMRNRAKFGLTFYAPCEMSCLAYHLKYKIWVDPKADFFQIDQSFAQMIDRNYLPIRMGLTVKSDTDPLCDLWSNPLFDHLVACIEESPIPRKGDILFALFDLNEKARNDLVYHIAETRKIFEERGGKDSLGFTFPIGEGGEEAFGISYLIGGSKVGFKGLQKELGRNCAIRKYQSRAKTWVGFGALCATRNMVDLAAYFEFDWEHDEYLEDFTSKDKSRKVKL